MFKTVFILGLFAIFCICESACQRPHIILPTYRPPPAPKRPIIMRVRRDNEPLWLNQGDIPKAPSTADHPFLPRYIDPIRLDPNRRVARSYGTPSVSRGGGTRQSSSRDTGPTHPGYNRRNTRGLLPKPVWPTLPPFNPRLPGPKYPWDTNPSRLPIYV